MESPNRSPYWLGLAIAALLLSLPLAISTDSSVLARLTLPAETVSLDEAGPRPFPDTSDRIAVFSDQLSLYTEAQYRFAASSYVGVQKMLRSQISRLREYNPGMLLLKYRLGYGLRYRANYGTCEPSGDYTKIVSGDEWVDEWPGDDVVKDSWFYTLGGSRVFNCRQGHYLMDIGNPEWRSWISAEMIAQMESEGADGLFADTYRIPSFVEPCSWRPCLPEGDPRFEAEWAEKMFAFSHYMKSRFKGRYLWIPNLAYYVTSRDPSDYSNVDGAMIEGFASWDRDRYFAPQDWRLQQDRILTLAHKGKPIIMQAYAGISSPEQRMFILGSYLLNKGSRSYIAFRNLWVPEWYPEYSLDLGPAVDPQPRIVERLLDSTDGVYKRLFEKGLVLVNPDSVRRVVLLPGVRYEALPQGGGGIGEDGVIPGAWRMEYRPVTEVTLDPHRAAVLLDEPPR